MMAVVRGIAVVIGCVVLFAITGGLVAAALDAVAPGYYRGVFPQSGAEAGVLAGVAQGILLGLLVGGILALGLGWFRQLRLRACLWAGAILAGCVCIGAILGGLIGLALGNHAPGYYRTVVAGGRLQDFNPVDVGVGLGASQGIILGVLVGALSVILVAWRRSRLAIMLSLALIIHLPLHAAEPEPRKSVEGFTPLFNGKDLTGWINVNCHPSTFFVKDKEIITTGKPTGFLRTDRQYENFIIDFEWMHVNKTAVGNSGLFVWGDPIPAIGTGYTRGIEVQVLVNLEFKDKKTGKVTATSHGDLFSIWGATCKPDRPHPQGWKRCLPSEYRAKGGGEWNHYRVTANNGVIKLEVNGKEVSGVSECNPRKGYLALESEGAECHFRNIMIKELPSTNPKPEEVADVDQGFKNLYLGDLSGWKVTDEAKDHWTPSDWRLAYDGKGGARGHTLFLESEYGDVELIADWRAPAPKEKDAPPTSAVFFVRGVAGRHVGLAVTPTTVSLWNSDGKKTAKKNKDVAGLKAGQWNRVRITIKGDKLTATINGKPTGFENETIEGVAAKGAIALQALGGPADFANIFVRELK
jgi:hypothetical protein